MSHSTRDNPSDHNEPPADARDSKQGQNDGRDESRNERADRNWSELLQELRVSQIGIQVLTGFLLTAAFQPRFSDLDSVQRCVYLALVGLTALGTVVNLAPVALHRAVFGRGEKRGVVQYGDVMLRITLCIIGLIFVGVTFLLFDVVLSRLCGFIAGGCVALFAVILWVVLPSRLRRSHESVDGAVVGEPAASARPLQ
ncbi:DUF6328 family protein [Lysinibacter cavernae]|uniref:Sodium:proton antiporter n=1 Tax=Lysinibacter cavernae TaxID=1640652 RepID=A0A7X5QZN6_9MICO|nr:DUF6328 family protein [Lysinibacter cavernae]NIH52888.1 hypothetical protein [Lysinibacter cavernae]